MLRRTRAPLGLVLCSLIATQCSSATLREGEADRLGDVYELPFELTASNSIAIRATLNDRYPVRLMLHTAVNSVSLTQDALKRMPGLAFEDGAEVSSWGGSSKASYRRGNTLAMGKLRFDDLGITGGLLSGRETDGKFGPNLFLPRILEIDFDARVLRLHRRLPELGERFVRIAAEVENGSLFVEGVARIGAAEYRNRFLVHSGFGGALLFDDAFVREQKLGARLEVVGRGELRDSGGNVLVTKKVLVPSFRIGGLEFRGASTSIFEGAIGRRKMSVLGADILRRMHVFFDLAGEQLFVRRSRAFDEPFAR